MVAKPIVLVAAALPEAGMSLLRAAASIEVGDGAADRGWLLRHAPGAAAIVANPSIPIDGELLDAAGPSLRVVSNFGAGYDNIDLEAVRSRGVRATNTPDAPTAATAELAVALMLAAGRRIAETDALVRDGRWPADFFGRELIGAVVGLVGFGRIAQRVAELLRGFEVRLLVNTAPADPPPTVGERCELDELLAASDFVSLHVPLTPETRHLIDAAALARMKPGAILVNTSRGGVVDTDALVEALLSGPLSAAALDVYEDEPHVPAAFRALPNTVLLPHLGSATAATRDAMARACAENVRAVLAGREPPGALV
jgi:glyoxylate reductase